MKNFTNSFRSLIFSITVLLFSQNLFSQDLIAVQNGNNPTFYTDLALAVAGAQAGDTLYIPGKSYGNITIAKKLHLVGVGHDPDSTAVTNKTLIGTLTLNTGADGGSVTGMIINSDISVRTINGYTISRNYIKGAISQNDGMVTPSNLLIFNNIIGNRIYFGVVGSGNHIVSNNIIISGSTNNFLRNSTVKNNIFYNLASGYYNYFTLIDF